MACSPGRTLTTEQATAAVRATEAVTEIDRCTAPLGPTALEPVPGNSAG